VETQLHHIEGLAEHFLYCNDDMFVGRRVTPSMFFSPGGISRFIESQVRIGGGVVDIRRSGHENAARNNRRLLADRFGYVITSHLAHSPAPLRRSVLAELEAEFPRDFAATQASRFRSATDISVTNSLYHYYALLTGRAVPHESASACYIETTSHDGLGSLGELLARRDADFFCLNDGGAPEVDEAFRATTVADFLACYFPCPAPWELSTAGFPERARGQARLPETMGLRWRGTCSASGMTTPACWSRDCACRALTASPTVGPLSTGTTECTTVSG
jgi:hypothetical protein